MSNHYELKYFNKSVSRRNLLFSNTPPNSPNINRHVVSTDENVQIPNENNNNENENNENENNENEISLYKKIINTYKNRKKNNYIRIPMHLLLHILLLSIFEILLFFNYVVVMEKNAFINKVEEYFKHYNNNINIDPFLIPYINTELNSDETMEWYDTIESNNYNSIDQYNNYNNQLLKSSWHGTFVLTGFFILYILVTFMFYKLSLKKLIFEHVILISLIGIYEYWFFINIILPYKIISSDELNYIMASCFFKKMNNVDGISLNSTLTDACNV